MVLGVTGRPRLMLGRGASVVVLTRASSESVSPVSMRSPLQPGCCCGLCAKCRDWHRQIAPLNGPDRPMPTLSDRSYFRVLMWLTTLGITLVMFSYVTYLSDPLNAVVNYVLTMSEGSFIFKLWLKPPVPVFLKVYIFNVTNADEFLKGGVKLKLEQVGPYVYREVLEHEHVRFNLNGTMSYVPKRFPLMTDKLVLDTSQGRGLEDKLVVPNIPLLGVASRLADQSFFMQVGFSTLVNYVDSQPFEQVTVKQYLWGYEDPIVRLASIAYSDEVTFKQLGLLDRMFDAGFDNVTMNTTTLNIDTYNGQSMLHSLNRSGMCDEPLRGVSEGVLFQRNVSRNKTLQVYRKGFCRTLAIQFEKEEPAGNVNGNPGGLRFVIPAQAFNASQNQEHSCHCGRKSPDQKCALKDGLSDIQDCYYGIPAAASFPHFLHADPSLLDKIEGLNPDIEKHQAYVVIQQQLGIPVGGHMRIQTNLVLKKNRFVKRIAPFGDMILPIVWTDLTFEEIPSTLQWMLNLCLKVVPPLQNGFIYCGAALGFSMLLAAFVGYLCLPIAAKPDRPSPMESRRSSKVVQVLMADELLRPRTEFSVAV
ncbi:lysosome membrane protein 2-like [Neocloeon triangulifer]|uniref:lysosome membrane protein 2-like n=1 Tax=Neocloeon triangulifer TaxID=2078957 RepID=UPI00286F2AA8|nr:lysosome membrane protein 2-like [Neocloeon triangulifer]